MPKFAEPDVPAAAAAGFIIRKLEVGWIIERRARHPGELNAPVAGFATLVEALEYLDQALARYEPPASA